MSNSVLEEKWPILARHEQAARWLGMWADLGRALRTIAAYGLGLAEYMEVCEREGVDPVEANRAHIAKYGRELSSRLGQRGANVVSIDSGAGLANATLQQRLVPVRLLYDFLIEEGLRESNPSAVAATRPVGVAPAVSGVCCLGWRNCRGSPVTCSGWRCWNSSGTSRSVIG